MKKSKNSSIFKAQKIKSDNDQVNIYKVRSTEYDEDTFKRTYIPIENFLKHSTFLGHESQEAPIIQLFYYNLKTGKILGRRKKGPFQIYDESILKRRYFSQNKKLQNYLNEQYLKHELSIAFESSYNLTNNRNTTKITHRK